MSVCSSIQVRSQNGTAYGSRARLFGSRTPASLARPLTRPVFVSCTKASSDARTSMPAISRRTQFAATLALGLQLTHSASASFGESANIFGKPNTTGFMEYKGDGYSFDVPSRWSLSREVEAPGVQVKFTDFYPANNVTVYSFPTTAKSVKDFESPEKFLDFVKPILGENVWEGKSRSEGGFQANQVSKASILKLAEEKGPNGKEYIRAHVLTNTADGTEGGRHHLISAAIDNSRGRLNIINVQVGEKRFVKGGPAAEAVIKSFAVA